ncbi:MAG: FAD-dependent oxidoreductase [Spirochaetales bacterium]|nr:FAD-dependent oxidoreductase [Spirochaetales bacterium]
MRKNKYLIVGVNAAGFCAIETIRRLDPNSEITAVNGEEYLPYKRTKINKLFSENKLDVKNFLLAPPEWYEENSIRLLTGLMVMSINKAKREVCLNNGEILKWDKLLLSLGADSCKPEGSEFNEAISIRSYEDALKIVPLIESGCNVVVYGLGLEAIETACQLKSAGLKVTLAGRGNTLLSRYFSGDLVALIKKNLAKEGVSVEYGIQSVDISKLPYDCLVYSTGISPRIDLARSGGIVTRKGIVVNERMETSDGDIYAAGDCAEVKAGVITDHWHAAQDQGRTAGENMTGGDVVWPQKKYRLKTELFGDFFFSMRPFKYDQTADLDSEISILPDRAFRQFYYRADRLEGVEVAGDRERAKLYEEAVNRGWSRGEVMKRLG